MNCTTAHFFELYIFIYLILCYFIIYIFFYLMIYLWIAPLHTFWALYIYLLYFMPFYYISLKFNYTCLYLNKHTFSIHANIYLVKCVVTSSQCYPYLSMFILDASFLHLVVSFLKKTSQIKLLSHKILFKKRSFELHGLTRVNFCRSITSNNASRNL